VARLGLVKPPRDLTRADFHAGVTDDQLLQVIRVGKGQMPAFGGLMDEKDLRDVIAFIRTLPPPGSFPPSAPAPGTPPANTPAPSAAPPAGADPAISPTSAGTPEPGPAGAPAVNAGAGAREPGGTG
jgi:hypothetical protein